MTRAVRRTHIAAAVPVVAVFTALSAWSIPAGGGEGGYWIALLFMLPMVLWLFTSWLLVHQWWETARAEWSTLDVPGQLLATAAATLPAPRQRWGAAMIGELAQIQGRADRLRFALSCARAALFLPAPTRLPALAVAALVAAAAAVAAKRFVGAALPGLGFFATSLVALLGVMVVVAIARARRVRPPFPVATVLVTGAVGAAIAVIAIFLVRHPTAAEGLQPARAAIIAAVLAGCLWLATAPPHRMGSSRLAPYLGIGAAAGYTLGGLAVARATLAEGQPAFFVLFGPVLFFAVPAFIAAAAGRSFRAGVQAGLWTAGAVMPLSLAVGLLEASRQYAVSGVWTFAGDVATAGFTLGFSFMTFLAVPVIGFPFAVIAATAGAGLRAVKTS